MHMPHLHTIQLLSMTYTLPSSILTAAVQVYQVSLLPFSSIHPLLMEQNLSRSVAQIYRGQMPFLSPNQQCQSTEGN